jgi:hypothetical protein
LVYTELIKTLEQNKDDIFYKLPKDEQMDLLNDLKINIESLRQSARATNYFEILTEQGNVELTLMHIQSFKESLMQIETEKRKRDHATDKDNLDIQRSRVE